ncbi:hypothetical protein HE1_00579 [Holospora elegans E1]|uniref:Transposase n=1 Tax=Holospora elegans E1 TaxID=1427503 RepID=A0A023DXS8_9PROT|nr:hypothetical protein HE1_00579 [Holospora elegans E1]
MEKLIVDPDYEWLMVDVSHTKVHIHAVAAKGGNQDMGRIKEFLTRSYNLAVAAHGMSVRIL